MPDPRTIALEKNDRSKFEPEPNDEQINPPPRGQRDVAANPTIPAPPAPPLKITNNG